MMETLTAKNFSLSDIVKKLAFNVPVVEKTAPCDECYKETPIKDLNSHGICPECAEEYCYCAECDQYMPKEELNSEGLCRHCDVRLSNERDIYADCMDIAHAAMEEALR